VVASLPRGGVQGGRWVWARAVHKLVFVLDAAAAGQQQWRALARQAALRGKQVAGLPPEAYGGHKDVNEAWVVGTLAVSAWPAAAAEGSKTMERPEELREIWAERAAIMEGDGGLARPVAEHAAWRWLTDASPQ
jgi:hypothetical protein